MNTIAAYAQDMSEFLNESELTERRAFIETFVKEIVVMPGDALLRYTVPMPDDSFLAGRATEKVALDASVLSTVHVSPLKKTRTRHRSGRGPPTIKPLDVIPLYLLPPCSLSGMGFPRGDAVGL